MKVFSISDLHLSGCTDKPMNIFGAGWEGHLEKIKADWQSKVCDDDIVLLCGDTSWGTVLEEGLFDLRSLTGLKGKKVFIRGNHDYWWNGITRLRQSAPDETFFFLQNDCVKFGNIIICGSRGWTCPGSADYTENDLRLYKREAERFKLCFNEVNKLRQEGDRLLVMIHYPPFAPKLQGGKGSIRAYPRRNLFPVQNGEKQYRIHSHLVRQGRFFPSKNFIIRLFKRFTTA